MHTHFVVHAWALCAMLSCVADCMHPHAIACFHAGLLLAAGITPVAENQDGTTPQGGCSISLPQINRRDTYLFEFGVAPSSEMSLIVVLRARGGTALM